MTIYLIRHGLASAGTAHLDPGLAPVGHQQAEAVASALRGLAAHALIVSPLARTRETAAPIAQVLALEPQVRSEVAEVFDPEMPAEERRAMIGPFMAGTWSTQPAHLRAWRQRVIDTLYELGLAASAATKDLVVVSHYIAIGVMIGEALGDDRVVPVPMANTAVTRLNVGHGGWTLVEACSTAHLPPELVTGLAQALPGG